MYAKLGSQKLVYASIPRHFEGKTVVVSKQPQSSEKWRKKSNIRNNGVSFSMLQSATLMDYQVCSSRFGRSHFCCPRSISKMVPNGKFFSSSWSLTMPNGLLNAYRRPRRHTLHFCFGARDQRIAHIRKALFNES